MSTTLSARNWSTDRFPGYDSVRNHRDGGPPAHPKPLNLHHLVAAALECNRTLIEETAVVVRQDVGAQLLWVWGGDSRLLQALAWTLSKICRPCAPNDEVHIDTLPSEPGFVTISVRAVPSVEFHARKLSMRPLSPKRQGVGSPADMLDPVRTLEPHCGRMNVYCLGDRVVEIVLTLPLYHYLLRLDETLRGHRGRARAAEIAVP